MICVLLLFAAISNHVDRQVIGILKPTLTDAFGWSDERIYSSIVYCFQLACGIGFPTSSTATPAWIPRATFHKATYHSRRWTGPEDVYRCL